MDGCGGEDARAKEWFIGKANKPRTQNGSEHGGQPCWWYVSMLERVHKDKIFVESGMEVLCYVPQTGGESCATLTNSKSGNSVIPET